MEVEALQQLRVGGGQVICDRRRRLQFVQWLSQQPSPPLMRLRRLSWMKVQGVWRAALWLPDADFYMGQAAGTLRHICHKSLLITISFARSIQKAALD